MENDGVTPKGLVLRDRRAFQPYNRLAPVQRIPFVPLNGGHSSRNYRPQHRHHWHPVTHWNRRGFPSHRRNFLWSARGNNNVSNNNRYLNLSSPSSTLPLIHPLPHLIMRSGISGGDENNQLVDRGLSNYSSIGSSAESEDSGSGICEDDEYVPQPVKKLSTDAEESVYKTGDSDPAMFAKIYGNPPLLPGCVADEDSFLEMHIACVAPGLLNKEKRAAFGVWFGKQSVLNFGDVLPMCRPQTLKGVLIWASTQAIQLMKTKGFIKLKLIMESEFMIQNVSRWAYKFMNAEVLDDDEKVAMCSNWDELKYVEEIWELSKIFKGMLLKWTHVTSETYGIKCAKSLARNCLTNQPQVE